MADLVGQTLGAYRIEAPLGAGGMGQVYRAVHLRLNRPAAIKVLHASQANDPTFQARFLREARAAAALSHPNIVEVFDFGEQDGASYLVMELVPNGSLRTLLRQRAAGQGWTLGLGVDLVRQAAEGLAYAHARGMVHRDIKPDNLLLLRLDPGQSAPGGDGERYTLKISDFGLARLVEDGGELTVSGVVMGTPTYMSPEQCQGATLDGRSDLYSLGVVLYEVTTGAPPFRVKSLSEAVFKHISAPPIPPREVRPDLPLTLDDVIMRCLAKDPNDRYATGTELAEALDGALGDTELRTVIAMRDRAAPATPTPAAPTPVAPTPAPAAVATPADPAPADPTAPTVAASIPGQHALATPPPVSAAVEAPASDAPPAVAGDSASVEAAAPDGVPDDATVSAEAMPTPPPQRQPAATAAGGAPSVWRPPVSHDTAAPAAPGGIASLTTLLARHRTPAIAGAGALLLLALLIVALVAGTHSPKTTVARQLTTPTAISSPTASPTPVETIKYQEALSAFSSKWPNSSHDFFGHGGYELVGAWIAYSPAAALGDGSIAVRTRQLGGPSDQFYGLLFRGATTSHYYFFGISGKQQWTFSVVTNGNGTSIVAPTTDSHILVGANASNTIMVRAIGGHFVFYINGAQVGTADSSSIASGRIGLFNTIGNLDVVYNDLTVWVPAG